MDMDKILNLSDDELKAEEARTAEQLFRIKFAKSLGKQEGLKNLRTLKLDIARFKTIARQRQIEKARQLDAAKAGN
jgi:large subunit ribosomal protein L29